MRKTLKKGARKMDRKKNDDTEEGDKYRERMLEKAEKPGTSSFIDSFLSVFLLLFSTVGSNYKDSKKLFLFHWT
jgi:hypothetical protein